MKLTTEYHIYFLQTSRASFAEHQQVFARNQDEGLNMPAAFASEDEALAWVEANAQAMSRKGEFVIQPVHRMGY